MHVASSSQLLLYVPAENYQFILFYHVHVHTQIMISTGRVIDTEVTMLRTGITEVIDIAIGKVE